MGTHNSVSVGVFLMRPPYWNHIRTFFQNFTLMSCRKYLTKLKKLEKRKSEPDIQLQY